MKKNIKKCFALLLAVVMTLTMALAVFAADNRTDGSLTTVPVPDNASITGFITLTSGSGQYEMFKIASASVKTGDKTYSYTVDDAYRNTFAEVFEKTNWTFEDVAVADTDHIRNLASKLETAVQNKKGTKISANSKKEVELGYYLIVEKENSDKLTKTQPILVAVPQLSNDVWTYDINITPKASSVNFEKKIVSNDRRDDNKWVDTSAEKIGDVIDYVTKSSIPQYDWTKVKVADVQYKIVDTPSAGLTLNNDSVHVYVSNVDTYDKAERDLDANDFKQLTKEVDYTFTDGFTVDFYGNYDKIKDYKYVYIFFSATLNENAVVSNGTAASNPDSNANPNDAKLVYSNNYIDASKTSEIPDKVKSYTFKFNLVKIAKGDTNATALEGAKFELKDSKDKVINLIKKNENEYRVATSKDDRGNFVTEILSTKSTIEIVGLDEGAYKLTETEAPAGYKIMDTDINFKVNATMPNNEYDGAYTIVNMDKEGTPDWPDRTITVEDEKGLTLPGTGGIGTTLFTFGGIALILIAGVMFIVYTRKQKKQS